MKNLTCVSGKFGRRHQRNTIKKALKVTCPHVVEFQPREYGANKNFSYLAYGFFNCEKCNIVLSPYVACCAKDIKLQKK